MQWPKQGQSSQQVQQERAADAHVKPKPRPCCQHWKDEDKSFAEAPAESYTFDAIIHKLVLFMNDSAAGNLSSCADVQISLAPSAVTGADHKEMFPLENRVLLYDFTAKISRSCERLAKTQTHA